jgi:hypothetical protein
MKSRLARVAVRHLHDPEHRCRARPSPPARLQLCVAAPRKPARSARAWERPQRLRSVVTILESTVPERSRGCRDPQPDVGGQCLGLFVERRR